MASETSNTANTGAPSSPLQDRVAIVTGASRGIGHLASLGAKLVVNYTSNSTQADLVASEINSASVSPNNPLAITVRADVSDPTQVKSLFDKAQEVFNSPVHILVNNAGVANPKNSTLANTSVEDFDHIFR
jgi:3-oxoacyl-[acyl-carrier protein] reductase